MVVNEIGRKITGIVSRLMGIVADCLAFQRDRAGTKTKSLKFDDAKLLRRSQYAVLFTECKKKKRALFQKNVLNVHPVRRSRPDLLRCQI